MIQLQQPVFFNPCLEHKCNKVVCKNKDFMCKHYGIILPEIVEIDNFWIQCGDACVNYEKEKEEDYEQDIRTIERI